MTEDEVADVFSKFGMIAESADSDQPRIKLYADENGKFKGDALIGEALPISVCLEMLTSLQSTSARNPFGSQFRCSTTPTSAITRKVLLEV